jgi:hypothetical protein
MTTRSRSNPRGSPTALRSGRSRNLSAWWRAAAGWVLGAGGEARATEQSRSVGVVIYDAVIERPVGLLETVVGAGITLVAYPLALGSGRTDVVLERCIGAPARYTFKRPLGDFSDMPRNDCGAVGLGWGTIRASLAIAERPLAFIFGRSPLSPDVQIPGDELEI